MRGRSLGPGRAYRSPVLREIINDLLAGSDLYVVKHHQAY